MDTPPVPSWDTDFPAKQQQASLDAASGITPPPNIAAADAHPKKMENPHAQMLPPANSNQPKPTGTPAPSPTPPPNEDAPPAYEDTEPVSSEAPPTYEDTAPLGPSYSDTLPDNSAMRKYVDGNLQVYNAANADRPPQPEQHNANSTLEALEAGLQISTSGLAIRGKMPDTVLPENSGRAFRIANQIGTLAGDMPAMLVGGVFGGLASSEVPIVGTLTGGAAGSFALPAALRKIMVDHYEKGDIKTAGEFMDRLMATTWEGMKGAATGLAAEATGGAAATVAGPMAKIGAELATMTTVGAAMEGHLPHAQDFLDGAIVLGGLHGVGLVSSKLRNIYAQTGEKPADVVQAANQNPDLKQQILGLDKEQPWQAGPSEIRDVPEVKDADGKVTKEAVRNQLFPVDMNAEAAPKAPDEKLTDAEASVKSMIGEKIDAEPESKWERGYANTVDFTDPTRRAVEAFKDATGKELAAEDDPHKLMRNFSGNKDMIERVFAEGVPDVNGKFDPESDSLDKVHADVPKDEQGKFDLYSIAKRAIELDDQDRNPGAKFNREDAEQVVKDGADKYEELHQRRVQAMNDALDYGVAKGVIDPKVAELSKEQNTEYVPMDRIIPPDEMTGEIGAGSSALVKKLEGSDYQIQNPRANFYNNIAAIVRRAAINDIRVKTLDNLSYEHEDGTVRNDFVREVSLDEKQLGKNQIAIFRDGKMSALEGTPLVIDSLKRLEGDRTMSDMVTKIAGAFATAARVGTIADPGFGFRHFFRATLLSGVYSKTGQIPFVHTLMDLPEFLQGKSEDFKNWKSFGGATQGFDELENNYLNNDLQESDAKYPFLNQAWNVIKSPFEATHAFIAMTDNLTRFTEAKRTVEQGGSWTQAAFNAREVTPDFAKAGLQRSALRTATAFQGAHIQSMDRMIQAFQEDTPGTILRMSALSGISLAVWAANRGDKDIDDLPDYKKDLYWNFNVPRLLSKAGIGDYSDKTPNQVGTIFSLPKPWGPGILFGSGTERTLDAVFKDNPDAYKGWAQSLWGSVVPPMMPTAMSPVADQFANKNFFSGRPLVTNEQQKELPEMQYQPYTSETAKQLGKLIQAVPYVGALATKINPNNDPLTSPAVIDNYIKGWTGTVGAWAIKIADAGLRQAGVTPKNVGPSSVDAPLADAPILSEFLTRFPSLKEQPMQDFYEKLDATNKVFNSVRDATKQGDYSHAMAITAQNPQLEFKLNTMNTAIGMSRKVITAIQQNPGIDPVQKRQLVDGQLFMILNAAKMGNKMMNDFQSQIEQSTTKGK